MKNPFNNPYVLIAIIIFTALFIVITGIQIFREVTFPCLHVPYSFNKPDIIICFQDPPPYRDLLVTY